MTMTRPRLSLGIRRPAAIALGVALATVVFAWSHTGRAQAATTCTWAGTPAAPTGTFTITPGLTNLPLAEPSKFVASGQLAGDDPRCHGEMKWVGQIDAGSNCLLASFEETVKGLAGVAHAWGKGSLDVPQSLYDRQGRLVGVENAQIVTQTNLRRALDCSTPRGFVGGWRAMFSSNMVLFDHPAWPTTG